MLKIAEEKRLAQLMAQAEKLLPPSGMRFYLKLKARRKMDPKAKSILLAEALMMVMSIAASIAVVGLTGDDNQRSRVISTLIILMVAIAAILGIAKLSAATKKFAKNPNKKGYREIRDLCMPHIK